MARSVLAEKGKERESKTQPLPSPTPAPSSSTSERSLTRVVGTAFSSHIHPLKAAANLVLVDLLCKFHGPTSPPNQRWAFILDTGLLNTTHSLASLSPLGYDVSRIVVANPAEMEVRKMRETEPQLNVFSQTSHEFLSFFEAWNHLPSPSSDSPLSSLIGKGWRPGQSFDCVWLDYCGSFDSTAGRKRQRDISLLFSVSLVSEGSIIAVTVSCRGSTLLYDREPIDSLMIFLERTAKEQQGCNLHFLSYVMYRVTCNICTVYVRVGKRGGALLSTSSPTSPPSSLPSSSSSPSSSPSSSSLYTPLRALSPSDFPRLAAFREQLVAEKKEYKLKSLSLVHSWRVADPAVSPSFFPLHDAFSFLSSVFTSMCLPPSSSSLSSTYSSSFLSPPSPHRFLVMDTRLCQTTVALLTSSLDASTRIDLLVDDPLDRDFVQYVLSPSLSSRVSISVASVTEHVEGEKEARQRLQQPPQPYTGVWLSYARRKPFDTERLMTCHRWSDVRSLFETSGCILGERLTVTLLLPYTPLGDMWEGMSVDLVHEGIERVAREGGYSCTLVFVATFRSGSPFMCLMFDCVSSSSISASSVPPTSSPSPASSHVLHVPSEAPQTPGWKFEVGWEREREKVPCRPAHFSSFLEALFSGPESDNRKLVSDSTAGVLDLHAPVKRKRGTEEVTEEKDTGNGNREKGSDKGKKKQKKPKKEKKEKKEKGVPLPPPPALPPSLLSSLSHVVLFEWAFVHVRSWLQLRFPSLHISCVDGGMDVVGREVQRLGLPLIRRRSPSASSSSSSSTSSSSSSSSCPSVSHVSYTPCDGHFPVSSSLFLFDYCGSQAFLSRWSDTVRGWATDAFPLSPSNSISSHSAALLLCTYECSHKDADSIVTTGLQECIGSHLTLTLFHYSSFIDINRTSALVVFVVSPVV